MVGRRRDRRRRGVRRGEEVRISGKRTEQDGETGGRRQDTSSEVNLSKGREGDYSMGGDESIRPERAGKAEREGGREWNPSSIHFIHPRPIRQHTSCIGRGSKGLRMQPAVQHRIHHIAT